LTNRENPLLATAIPVWDGAQGATAGWKRIEADEHFYGFGERTGFLDKLSEVKTNWTTDALDYNSLSDEMYQAIAFYIALNPDRAYGIFFNTTFWSQFDIGAEQPGFCGWKPEARNSTTTSFTARNPPKLSPPTRS
jgi:alpha-glucosidase